MFQLQVRKSFIVTFENTQLWFVFCFFQKTTVAVAVTFTSKITKTTVTVKVTFTSKITINNSYS